MKKPPDPPPSPSSCQLLCHPQGPLLAAIDASDGFTSNRIDSFRLAIIMQKLEISFLLGCEPEIKSKPFMRGKIVSVKGDLLPNPLQISGFSSLSLQTNSRLKVKFGAFQSKATR